MLYLLLILPAAAAGQAAENPLPRFENFDLKGIPPPPCASSEDDEIVVCGKPAKEMDIRVDDPETFRQKPFRPEMKLPFGGTIDLHAEQRSVGAFSAPAAVVTVKIPF